MSPLYKDPEEAWERADGAPQGPDFDYLIPSSRTGHGPYRMVRQSHTGRMLHIPACEAWTHGHRNCRHVQESVYRSEQPGSAFYEDVDRMLSESAWWASGDEAKALCAAIVRQRDETRKQMEDNAARAAYVAEGPDHDFSELLT